MKDSKRKKSLIIPAVFIALMILAYIGWPSMINLMMPADSRPGKILFEVENITLSDLQKIGDELSETYGSTFAHVERFREEGIVSFEVTGSLPI